MKIDIRSFLLACMVVSASLCSSVWAQGEVDRATELGRSGNWTDAKQVPHDHLIIAQWLIQILRLHARDALVDAI